MGASHCTGVCTKLNSRETIATVGCCDSSWTSTVHSIFQANDQETLQMLLLALDAFEENRSQEEQGPAVISAQQRRSVDAALDSWMACLPRQKGVPLVVDGTDCQVSLRLSDPAELILKPRQKELAEAGAEHLNMAMLSGIEIGTRQIPPDFGPGTEGCCTTRPAECILVISEPGKAVRKLRVECEGPVSAASFGLTLRILQSIGPGALSSAALKSAKEDKKDGGACSKKRPRPGKLKLEHLTGLARDELSARLSSRSHGSQASARGSGLQDAKGRGLSIDSAPPDSARSAASAPIQGVTTSYSTRLGTGKNSKSRKNSTPGTRRSPSKGSHSIQETSIHHSISHQGDGPEAAAGSPLEQIRLPGDLSGGSKTPSAPYSGSLLPKWYHQAMDDNHDDAQGNASLHVAPEPEESPSAQEVKAFLNDCGLSKHCDALIQSGFDSMEALQHAEDEHLEKVGLPLGHRLLLIRKLKGKTCVLDEEEATVFDSLDMQRFRVQRKRTLDRSFQPESP
eukprot:gnl/MRDRNA2_/MRDRNA2_130669_c0_seq1.p1 gnl/MRDRNA2_/MRDRNA2_130669_c0~~gnl/MRDRNA2_/MRDRNA2_130669_c0_seq1.p1  ORF type:complete len:511 (+),score=94.83 gnl/MRDRNA2_/MRDRNA2_130669_c0_seq1:331-1863(+)